VKYNLNYSTVFELLPTGVDKQSVFVIRVVNIETGTIVANAEELGSLKSAYKSAIGQIKTQLADEKIEGVILPSVNQINQGVTSLSPSEPLPGSLISSSVTELTPAAVLDSAINKSTTASTIPTSETVLSKETAKPSPNLPVTANIKPAKIEQPSPKPEEQVKLTSPDQTSAIAATSGNVASIASTPAIQAQTPAPLIANTTINNNITNSKSESANNSNSAVNSKNVLNNEANSEKNTSSTSISEKTKSITVESDPTVKMLETLMGIPQSATKNEVSTVNQKSANLSSVNKTKESINSKLSNVLKSTVDNKLSTSTKEEEETKANQAMLNTLMGIPNIPESTEVNKTNINKTNTNESVNVKSTKLVESSSVKKMLEPDKTLEKSVGKLSKDLPAAVNNLSSSVTSMNPQTSSSSSITNEGNNVDQSSKTVINQNSGQTGPQEQTSRPKEMGQPPQSSDFYLQGIYAALMSGKIKVKLEYQ